VIPPSASLKKNRFRNILLSFPDGIPAKRKIYGIIFFVFRSSGIILSLKYYTIGGKL